MSKTKYEFISALVHIIENIMLYVLFLFRLLIINHNYFNFIISLKMNLLFAS